MEASLLTAKEKEDIRDKLIMWTFHEKNIERKFEFANFQSAFSFMMQVAFAAEKIGHHPDWQNVYNKVVIKLSTHDLDGLSHLDIKLAEEIDQMYD